MIMDALTRVSNAQAFTGADEVSASSVDLGDVTPKRDIGAGEPLAMLVAVTTAADTGDETYQFELIQSANADLSSHDTLLERVVSAATLTVGTLAIVPIPPGAITKRYIGARALLGGTTPTVSATIWFAPMSFVQFYKSYARNYVIL